MTQSEQLPRFVRAIHNMSEVAPQHVTKAEAAERIAAAVLEGYASTVWQVITDYWPVPYQVGTIGTDTLLWWEA